MAAGSDEINFIENKKLRLNGYNRFTFETVFGMIKKSGVFYAFHERVGSDSFFEMRFGIVTGVTLVAEGRMNDERVREDAEPA